MFSKCVLYSVQCTHLGTVYKIYDNINICVATRIQYTVQYSLYMRKLQVWIRLQKYSDNRTVTHAPSPGGGGVERG